MYKFIIFDLDNTLLESKSPVDVEMLELLRTLLERFKVWIISGSSFKTMQKNLLSFFKKWEDLSNLYLMPTIWTKLYRQENKERDIVYEDNLSNSELKKIKEKLNFANEKLWFKIEKPYWEIIENRWWQVTYSALWQQAPLDEKKKRDPDRKKREKIVNLVEEDLQEFELSVAWTSSIDVNKKWIDKKYWISKCLRFLNISESEVLFVWDELFEWWNDFPVTKMNIDTKQVESPEQSKKIIRELIVW